MSGGGIIGFDTMLGGGLDVGHGHLAFRVIQADWMLTRFSGYTDKKNVRVSTRLVLRFLPRRKIRPKRAEQMTIYRSLSMWSLMTTLNVIRMARPWLMR